MLDLVLTLISSFLLLATLFPGSQPPAFLNVLSVTAPGHLGELTMDVHGACAIDGIEVPCHGLIQGCDLHCIGKAMVAFLGCECGVGLEMFGN